MIALYPLLVSNTISRNIVPGVAKVLENYIIVYGLSGLLDRVRKSSGVSGDYRIKLNKVIKTENIEEHLPGFLYREIIEEQSGIGGSANPGSKTATRGSTNVNVNINMPDDKKDKGKDASVRLDTFNMESISLEPTWMKLDQYDREGNKSTGLIGVKVVPYAVKSDADLSQLLMYDNQVSKLQRLAILTGRNATSFLYRAWMSVWSKVPLFGGRPEVVTGDPRKDILLKRNIISAGHAQDIFVLANQAELNDNFYASAKGMMNLQKMGWGSIMIADDVNRRVAFCMNELKGLCSIMPYTMLYQTFSQAKVYEDIEDAKRNASSIFKVARKPMAKIIGEGIAQTKVENFGSRNLPMFDSEFISEMEYIDENLSGFIKSMNPMKMKMALLNLTKGNVDKIPTVSNEKLVQYGMKINPEFRKGHIFAKKVIENSTPEVSEKMADVSATLCCVYASVFKSDNFMDGLKETLKRIIMLFRKFKPKGDPNKVKMPAAHFMDAVFGWIVILFWLAALAYSFPAFQAIGSGIYKFTKMSVDFLEGVNGQAIMKTAQETAQSLQPQEYLSTHAPLILLAILGMAWVWSFIKGDSK